MQLCDWRKNLNEMGREMSRVNFILRLAIPVVFCTAATAQSEPETALVDRAVLEYSTAMDESRRDLQLQRFGIAEQLFRQCTEQVIRMGRQPSADLYLNLGNAAVQARHIGVAISAWRRALEVAPDHRAAKQNLEYARAMLPETVRRVHSERFSETLFFWTSWLTPRERQTILALIFLLSAVSYAVGINRKLVLLRRGALLFLGCWGVLELGEFSVGSNVSRTEAVVIVEDCVLRSADSENSAPRLANPLPDGTEVELVQARERWLEVSVAGRTGWVLASQLDVL